MSIEASAGPQAGGRLEIRTLGGLQLVRDGEVIPVSGRRPAEALLVYLARQPRALPRELLADFLWPERPTDLSLGNLRVTLHRLRQSLGLHLAADRHTVGLSPDSNLWLDVSAFDAHLAAGQHDAAVALYGGAFLDGFYLDKSPAFEQWLLVERERLHNEAVSAGQTLLNRYTQQGDYEAAIAQAQRLLQIDPYHEPALRQLLRLLAQTGRRATALTRYETFRRSLLDELAVEPDPATVALARQLETASQEPLPTPPIARRPRHAGVSWPQAATRFVGRTAELGTLAAQLADLDCRLLTVVGPGGIGKTRLAIEAGRQQEDRFADGVFFVPLVGVTAPAHIIPAIAQALAFVFAPSADPEEEICGYLRHKEMLLVLDNFEQLLAGDLQSGAGVVDRLLQATERLKILVTSRQRLSLREEWLLPVHGLSTADSAVELLAQCARRVEPTFSLAGQEPDASALCDLVGGTPLAIELAAIWAPLISCRQIANQIRSDLDFLTTNLANMPGRHRSLRALFEGSWQALSPVEQRAFACLAVFRGGFGLGEAAAVAGASPAVLLGLVGKSLVHTAGSDRFELHELVRQYAAEKLAETDEFDNARQRHFDAYLALAQTADGWIRGHEQEAWLRRLDLEQDNLRSALDWSAAQAQGGDLVARLVLALRLVLAHSQPCAARPGPGWTQRYSRANSQSRTEPLCLPMQAMWPGPRASSTLQEPCWRRA